MSRSLWSICQEATAVTPGYLFGGEHDKPIKDVRLSRRSDCSSSTSRVLYLAGFFPHNWSFSSGDFARWGAPGVGDDFTVWYRWNHVWIQFHGRHAGWRFDTSPWGDGGRGCRLRNTPRPTAAFQPRHVRHH